MCAKHLCRVGKRCSVTSIDNCQGPVTRAAPKTQSVSSQCSGTFFLSPVSIASSSTHSTYIPSNARVTQALKRLGLYEARQCSLFLSIVCQCNVLAQVKFYNKSLQAVTVTCVLCLSIQEVSCNYQFLSGASKREKELCIPVKIHYYKYRILWQNL